MKAGQTANRLTQSPGSCQRHVLPSEMDDANTFRTLRRQRGKKAVRELSPSGTGAKRRERTGLRGVIDRFPRIGSPIVAGGMAHANDAFVPWASTPVTYLLSMRHVSLGRVPPNGPVQSK